ncbi:MAG: selenocysteine-specific translation elongation factor [Deltaproteobacteria bacterium RIFOXYA12_FULL_58_15]|nr:MAG: selenocysteine-specific translation elongation factor [Deltaproteobacteria bacterium RIFOXYA12_FULL_58_15]OGR07648.1 MAG: selenocysteine-specific translation elongation factor [Deltaproteobacteria bacterium RIFOXYB12_FULL_58_9]
MNNRHIVLGTAGHIDHGKTALVRALTGVDTDRLPEEKRRGITIELGFAPWRIDDEIEASIIDVPGHERLVRTMVAGAFGMDLAMLVVAADDGVMPQTREHLDVLHLLGVPAGLVVLSKCDLVDADLLELVEEDVRETCRGTVFAGSPIVQTSTKTGKGLDELRGAVAKLAAHVKRRPTSGAAFVPLDRVFTKAGYGTVATGTTLRGSIRVGDAIEVFTAEHAPISGLKVRGLQALGTAADEVVAGMRTAINIAGRDADKVKRGMVLAHEGVFRAVEGAILQIEVLPRATRLEQESLTVHVGTSERTATIIPLGVETIEPGKSGGALLRFDQPVAAFAGQRVVLRRPGVHGQATVAGGVILDPEPPQGKSSVSLAASQVEALFGSPRQRLLALARQSRAAGIDAAALERRMPPGQTDAVLKDLVRSGTLVALENRQDAWVAREVCDAVTEVALSLVSAHHDAMPLSAGLAEAEVASQLPPPERHLAGLAVQIAVDGGKLMREGALLAIPGRGSAVDEKSKQLLEAMQSMYSVAGLMPPSDTEVAKNLGIERKRFHELVGLLRRREALTRVSDSFHYDTASLHGLEIAVVSTLREQGEMTASDLKTLAGGISRKWAIPLLEYFDRCRVTMRVDDIRKLHPSRR